MASSDCNLLKLNSQKIEILPAELQAKLYKHFAKSLAGYLLKAEGKK